MIGLSGAHGGIIDILRTYLPRGKGAAQSAAQQTVPKMRTLSREMKIFFLKLELASYPSLGNDAGLDEKPEDLLSNISRTDTFKQPKPQTG